MGFLGSLIWYSCLFLVLVAVAVAGVFVGKALRSRKDDRNSALDNTGKN